MITEYATQDGYVLALGRIPRQHIDTFTSKYAPPEPPLKEVETWAGTERVPDLDDSAYVAAMDRYYIQLAKSHVELIAPAVELPAGVDIGELYELRKANLLQNDNNVVGFLLYMLSDDDMSNVVQIILYNSTVTERGIAEAAKRYNVLWMNKSVMAWHVPGTPGAYGAEFEARLAARYALMAWEDFCNLTGPEQSASVCFFRQANRLDYFQAKWTYKK